MARTGRPRGFDEDALMQRATEVFWRNGYAGTSMRTLKDALGVLPGSLYSAYGDKHELFLRVLDHYIALQQEDTARLLAAPQIVPALRESLVAVLQAAIDAPGRGCLLGNTSAEVLPDDSTAAGRVSEAFADQEQLIHAALSAAQEAGEIRGDIDTAAEAQLLLALMQGLHVLARTESNPHRLDKAIDAALDRLT